jgi:formate dehydrogenase subunit delta
MANEIAAFFQSAANEDEAAASVANHLRRFWDPRMRRQIIEHRNRGGAGLSTLANEAVGLLSDQPPM